MSGIGLSCMEIVLDFGQDVACYPYLETKRRVRVLSRSCIPIGRARFPNQTAQFGVLGFISTLSVLAVLISNTAHTVSLCSNTSDLASSPRVPEWVMWV